MSYSNKFAKAFRLPGTLYRVLKSIAVQQKFLKQFIAPILAQALQQNDGSLDAADIKKINQYYGLAVPAILGEAFCILRGKPMSSNERWASTSQGAMTGLFDDFFDKDYLSDEAVEEMIWLKDIASNKKANQQLFDIFYSKALELTPDKKLLQDALFDVYKAQVESKKQLVAIHTETLTNITYFKGGSSVFFYRTVFTPEAIGKEKEIIDGLGSLMQLGNDIFDVYKDREAGIRTLVTETKNIGEIRALLKNGLQKYYTAAYELGYHAKNTGAFLDILSISIFSRCFVCLDQLEANQKLTGNVFEVHKYSRKQLICDMDKKLNMLRSAWKHIVVMP